MPEDANVWQALLRAKGLTVAQLAEELHTTRQHAHRLLTGKRSADPRRDELDRALALGQHSSDGHPVYGVAVLSPDGEIELLPAGDAQPLFADRNLATSVAESLERLNQAVCAVPVWPEYAWRRTVAFHAAWGSSAEARNIFLVDDPRTGLPVETIIEEIRGGYEETLRLRAAAEDPVRVHEVDSLLAGLVPAQGASAAEPLPESRLAETRVGGDLPAVAPEESLPESRLAETRVGGDLPAVAPEESLPESRRAETLVGGTLAAPEETLPLSRLAETRVGSALPDVATPNPPSAPEAAQSPTTQETRASDAVTPPAEPPPPGQAETLVSGISGVDPVTENAEGDASSLESIGPGRQIGHYRVNALIGRGALGAVYRADRLPAGGQAALKVLPADVAADDAVRRRFVLESRYAAALDHPNIPHIYGAGEADGFLYIAMEYVPGTNLETLLALDGWLEPRRALDILTQAAAALDAAHAQGILHRDLEPANILISSGEGAQPEGHCYVTDFGLSTGAARSNLALTAPGEFVGTSYYTAPEQILGKECDQRADVYSLGCVLYACLAGEPPFSRERETDVLYGHLQEDPPQLTERRPDLPPALDDVIARAMAKDREARYGSCMELMEDARAAITPGKLSLTVTAGNAAGTRIEVDDELLVGRHASEEGRLAGDVEISGEHARISRRPDGTYVIEDLHSTNGTFVNGQRIDTPQTVAAGDTIEVGSTMLLVGEVSVSFEAPDAELGPSRSAETITSVPSAAPADLPSSPRTAHPSRLSLWLKIDWDSKEVLLGLDEETEPIKLLREDDRWRVAPHADTAPPPRD